MDYGLKLEMVKNCQELSTYYLGMHKSTIKGLYSGQILLVTVNELQFAGNHEFLKKH